MPASCAEGVRADDRLCRLHRDADDRREQARLDGRSPRADPRLRCRRRTSGARLESPSRFFHRGVAARSPMPFTVHSNLTRRRAHRGEAVRDGEAEVVVAVRREHGALDAGTLSRRWRNSAAISSASCSRPCRARSASSRRGAARSRRPRRGTPSRSASRLGGELDVVAVAERFAARAHRPLRSRARASCAACARGGCRWSR